MGPSRSRSHLEFRSLNFTLRLQLHLQAAFLFTGSLSLFGRRLAITFQFILLLLADSPLKALCLPLLVISLRLPTSLVVLGVYCPTAFTLLSSPKSQLMSSGSTFLASGTLGKLQLANKDSASLAKVHLSGSDWPTGSPASP